MTGLDPLQTIGLFHDLSQQEREALSSISTTRIVKKGDALFSTGDSRSTFFIVLTGQVHIYRIFENEVQTLAVLDHGEFAVETALVNPSIKHEHNGEVLADGQILEIDGKKFVSFAAEHPAIANRIYGRIIENLSERLHHANNKFVTLYSTGKIAATYAEIDHLADLILTTILETIKAKRAIFALFKPLEGKIDVVEAKGYGSDQGTKNLDLSLGSDPLLGAIYRTRQNLRITKEQFGAAKDLHTEYASPTMLGVPLYVRDRVIGAILLGDKVGDEGFSHNNEILLSIIAKQIVLAVITAEQSEEKRV